MAPSTELIVDAIATYRLTKLVTDDIITAPTRHRIIRDAYGRQGRLTEMRPEGAETWDDVAQHDPDAPKVATLVTCRWCAGVWVAAAVVVARRAVPRLWAPVADVAVCAAAGALLARLED